jgi:hypothetical protein
VNNKDDWLKLHHVGYLINSSRVAIPITIAVPNRSYELKNTHKHTHTQTHTHTHTHGHFFCLAEWFNFLAHKIKHFLAQRLIGYFK